MRSKWHFSIILHSEFDSAYPKNPGKRSTNKVLPCLIRLTLTFMFWPLTSRNKVKMTSNQKSSIGFGFSTPENPRIRIFSKCIRILAPQIKYEFYALSSPYTRPSSHRVNQCQRKKGQKAMQTWKWRNDQVWGRNILARMGIEPILVSCEVRESLPQIDLCLNYWTLRLRLRKRADVQICIIMYECSTWWKIRITNTDLLNERTVL